VASGASAAGVGRSPEGWVTSHASWPPTALSAGSGGPCPAAPRTPPGSGRSSRAMRSRAAAIRSSASTCPREGRHRRRNPPLGTCRRVTDPPPLQGRRSRHVVRARTASARPHDSLPRRPRSLATTPQLRAPPPLASAHQPPRRCAGERPSAGPPATRPQQLPQGPPPPGRLRLALRRMTSAVPPLAPGSLTPPR
jgi:hypothetical protein